jgi:hypothetical protein
MKTVFTIGIAMVALQACSGTMQAVDRTGREAVSFTYEQGMDSDTLMATVGAEQFRGRTIFVDNTATYGTIFGSDMSGGFSSGQLFGSTSSGKAKATLLGTRGSSMRCLLNYADPSGFTTAGGVGECQHSDGRMIDVVW